MNNWIKTFKIDKQALLICFGVAALTLTLCTFTNNILYRTIQFWVLVLSKGHTVCYKLVLSQREKSTICSGIFNLNLFGAE